MRSIELTQGKVTYVDDEDFVALNKFKWCARKNRKVFYAIRRSGNKTEQMHAVIMKTPKGLQTDHIDGDGLNNQRSNLRVCTQSENRMNTGGYKNNKSGFRGVYWKAETKKWAAQITAGGKQFSLGYFKTKELAHEAYCRACVKYHGEFARTK